MAIFDDAKSAPGSYHLDTVSDGNLSRASYDDESGPDYISERARRTFIGRALHAVGMDVARHRKPELDYFSSQEQSLEGLLRQRGSRDSRRCRRSKATSTFRRALLIAPVFLLASFGILHITQAFAGRARLLWDDGVDDDDFFLPTWGQPGEPGEGLSSYPTDATRDVIPVPCHSHNDYWRRIPLLDALHWGCTGVEADVWLFDEELFVGHNTGSLTRNRTFQNLYIHPLVQLLDAMNPRSSSPSFANTTGHGVFDESPHQTLVLLVDIKTSGHDTFPHLLRQLEPLREKGYLTHWNGSAVVSRAVTVVGTGNTPFDLIAQSSASSYRDVFFDAPLDRMWEPDEPPAAAALSSSSASVPRAVVTPASASQNAVSHWLGFRASGQGHVGIAPETDFDVSNSYYASMSFASAVGFVWRGHLSPRQMGVIRGQIRGAQRRGLKVRYWDTPSWPVGLRNHVWHVLMKEGADVLNVDDLRAAATMNWKHRVHGFW